MLVVYRGNEHMINDDLLIENKVEHNLFNIIKIRNAITNLFEAEESGEYIGMEYDLLKQLEELEFQLQEQWGFPKDKRYHVRQFELNRCLCSYFDNIERMGIGGFWFNNKCPYHGMKEKE